MGQTYNFNDSDGRVIAATSGIVTVIVIKIKIMSLDDQRTKRQTHSD